MTSPLPAVPLDWGAATGDPEQPIPFGVDEDGKTLYMNRDTSPHLLVTGGAGTGKSKFLQSHVAAGIVRGEEFVVIDIDHGGPEYDFARPWLRGFADDHEAAASLAQSVDAECWNRVALIRQSGVRRYQDLPDEVRPPRLTLIVDGLASFDLREIRSKTEPEAEAAARLLAYVRKLAAEARWTGINVIVSGALSVPLAGAVGHTNFARLALGRLDPTTQRYALRHPDTAPRLGFFSVPGLGVYEPFDGTPTAARCWVEPSGADALTRKLTELAPPRSDA